MTGELVLPQVAWVACESRLMSSHSPSPGEVWMRSQSIELRTWV